MNCRGKASYADRYRFNARALDALIRRAGYMPVAFVCNRCGGVAIARWDERAPGRLRAWCQSCGMALPVRK